MKKFVVGVTLALALGLMTVPAFAAPIAYDAETAVENYLAAQDARLTYLQSLLESGLLTQEQYDLSAARVQADMDYVEENGLPNYGGGYGGYGYGGCCGGYGMMGW